MTAPPLTLRVLVVDDEKNIRQTLGVCLEGLGCAVEAVGTADAAVAAVTASTFDLAFVDLRLATTSGLDLVPQLRAAQADLDIVIITAYATIDTAVEAMRRGAHDYLPKPFTPVQIRHLVAQVAERRTLGRRVAALEREVAASLPAGDAGTLSPAMQPVWQTLSRAAPTDATVLLRGESGTGKSALARGIHAQSQRRAGPFVIVNCPTLSEELLASELFGHARGSFTGAVRDQAGRVEAAEGGTLFLDEIGELPAALQAKLLRFLQDREFERIGENRTRRADVRVLAATNRDLDADVRAGRFREDLYYRLAVIEVRVPALRERIEDIPALARNLLETLAREMGRPAVTLSPATEALLRRHPWPGNLRELRNVLERALILWPASVLEPGALPERLRDAAPPERAEIGGDHTIDRIEEEHIRAVLARAATQEQAARILGIDTSTLWRKRKRYEG